MKKREQENECDVDDISYSAADEKFKKAKATARFSTKIYFWMFVVFVCLALFMFWNNSRVDIGPMDLIIGIVSICMGLFFGVVVFIRFVRSRSITSGLFFTTAVSSIIFLGAAQIVPAIMPPAVAAYTGDAGSVGNGFQLMYTLARVGLFAAWFGFLLFTIFLYVQPVRKIDKYLGQLADGEVPKKVKIGNARQYKVIEEKIEILAQKLSDNSGGLLIDRPDKVVIEE